MKNDLEKELKRIEEKPQEEEIATSSKRQLRSRTARKAMIESESENYYSDNSDS